MWRTPVGNRHLVGQEAELFRSGLAMLVDLVSEYIAADHEDPQDRWAVGPSVFDQLTATQQLAVLYEVARHLLHHTPAPAPLTAATESAIASVFDMIRDAVRLEAQDDRSARDADVRQPRDTAWRTLVLEAYNEVLSQDDREQWFAEGMSLPTLDELDGEDWDSLVERLSDRILWDRDHELCSLLLDIDPAKAGQIKQSLGVDENYFSAIAPDTRPRDVQLLLRKLRALTDPTPF
jgi:hypothetical protein